jgi:L-threonylcarbamoyladenylate synthase
VLRRGGLVAFPTETVYGLGANALDADAVAGIFRAKGRPANNPIIVHVAEPHEAQQVVTDWPDTAQRLAAPFWPGPLTLVLPKRETVPGVVTAGGPTVAVRVPAHPVALALIRAAGVPLAAPSANRSSRLSPTRAEHVLRDLDGLINMALDAGPTPGGLESTVLDLTSSPPRLLRPGLVGPDEIEAVIGPISRAPTAAEEVAVRPSPGMMARHYAPRTPLECVEGDAMGRVRALVSAGERVGWLMFGRWIIWDNLFAADPNSKWGLVFTGELPCDPVECAAKLYDLLHQFDQVADQVGLPRIVVEMPPDTPEWLAVRDRLRRAASAE